MVPVTDINVWNIYSIDVCTSMHLKLLKPLSLIITVLTQQFTKKMQERLIESKSLLQ